MREVPSECPRYSPRATVAGVVPDPERLKVSGEGTASRKL